MMPMLSCRNVTIGYDGRAAVRDVSFELDAGDYLCIVGENGSGKSTLMKGILGLMNPAGGQIALKGETKRKIGYLPQQSAVRGDFPASVYEVVLSGCLNRHGLSPFYTKDDKARADIYIQRMEIGALKRKSYRDLSGGQQQRVLLARALCSAEKLLMLDEPTAGLDPKMTAEMYAILERLNREYGLTLIMISHDIKSAVKYGNKILHLRTSPIFFGPTGEYLKTEMYGNMLGGSANA